jgi:23S rRNA (cytidine1920-2'-O)/16S rRNA (cytidine1409-2'-O)-methyltransferase
MLVRLDKILVNNGIAASRARAQDMINSGKISIRNQIITNPKREFENDIEINVISPDIPWVSRAALKLVRALEEFKINPKDKVCLDIGASTGGFTQVLLSNGAKHVYAIDVGRYQFHNSLQSDERITVREGTHIKDVQISDFIDVPSLIVIDISFISLEKVLPKASELLSSHGDIVALIKPQFEVGKENVGKGIIKDPILHKSVCDKISELGKSLGFTVIGPINSPIEGGDGNLEFLIHFKR